MNLWPIGLKSSTYRYATEPTYLSKKEQLKNCFTAEMLCVVLVKEVEEQRQRLPHTIADTFLGPADHQK